MSKISYLYDRYTEGFKYTWFEPQPPPSKYLADYMIANPPLKPPESLTGKPLAEWWIAKIRGKDVDQVV
jgi:hypothetical protein